MQVLASATRRRRARRKGKVPLDAGDAVGRASRTLVATKVVRAGRKDSPAIPSNAAAQAVNASAGSRARRANIDDTPRKVRPGRGDALPDVRSADVRSVRAARALNWPGRVQDAAAIASEALRAQDARVDVGVVPDPGGHDATPDIGRTDRALRTAHDRAGSAKPADVGDVSAQAELVSRARLGGLRRDVEELPRLDVARGRADVAVGGRARRAHGAL